jgi:hypothetical protein
VSGLQAIRYHDKKPPPPAPPVPPPVPRPPPAPTILKASPATIAALTGAATPEARARAISKVVQAIPRGTRSQAKVATQPRRSARIAAK